MRIHSSCLHVTYFKLRGYIVGFGLATMQISCGQVYNTLVMDQSSRNTCLFLLKQKRKRNHPNR